MLYYFLDKVGYAAAAELLTAVYTILLYLLGGQADKGVKQQL